MSTGINIAYCLIGIAVFVGFFLIDFFRLATEEDTWESAISVTMNLYLDYINVLFFVLRLLGIELGGKKD